MRAGMRLNNRFAFPSASADLQLTRADHLLFSESFVRHPSQPVSGASTDRCSLRQTAVTAARCLLIVAAMSALRDSASVCHADGVRILQDDREAFQARIDLIQQASSEICVACFSVDTSEAPMALMELLRQASQRGIHVRLLLDDLASQLPADFEAFLRNSGVQLRVYHRVRSDKPIAFNRRLHDKLLIVDGHHLVMGSRNLRNKHYGLAAENFIDCDAYLHGDIAAEAQCYFDWLWCSAEVQPAPPSDALFLKALRYRPRKENAWSKAWRQACCPSQYQRLLDKSVTRTVCQLGVQLDSGTDWSAGITHPVEACLLHDRRLDKSCRQMQRGIIRLVDAARTSLVIETPYPAFDHKMRDAIIRASCRGVRVTIITNSLKSTDRLAVYAAYQNDKRRLLTAGVRLYEFCGDGCLHAKSMLIDDCVSLIGSHNFDSRSDHCNLEICVIIRDSDVAEMLKQSIAGRKCRARRIAKKTLMLDTVGGDDWLLRMRMMLSRTGVEFYRRLL